MNSNGSVATKGCRGKKQPAAVEVDGADCSKHRGPPSNTHPQTIAPAGTQMEMPDWRAPALPALKTFAGPSVAAAAFVSVVIISGGSDCRMIPRPIQEDVPSHRRASSGDMRAHFPLGCAPRRGRNLVESLSRNGERRGMWARACWFRPAAELLCGERCAMAMLFSGDGGQWPQLSRAA